MQILFTIAATLLLAFIVGCGGAGNNPPTPIENQWVLQPTGALNQARDMHTATLLPDGRVLVVGGELQGSSMNIALASAELYDPRVGTWSPAGSLVHKRLGHSSILLPNGKVIILGGWNILYTDWVTGGLPVEEWNPITNQFRVIGSLLHNHADGQAFLRQDGRIQVVGGYDHNLPITSDTLDTEIFDPVSGQSFLDFPLNELESSASLVPIDTSRFLLLGGANGLGGWHQLDSVNLYSTDGSLPNPSAGGRMPAAFSGNTAVNLPAGKVVVGGGYNQSLGGAIDAICVIDYTHPDSTILITKLNKVRMGHQTMVLPNGNVGFVAGETFTGQESTNYLSDIEVLDLQSMKTSILPVGLKTPRTRHTLTKLQDGSYFIVGGYNYYALNRVSLSSCERLIYQ